MSVVSESLKTVPIREQLAALEHKQWAHWTRYMLSNLTSENIERWRNQCEIDYVDLSESEKDSDRYWADQVLAVARGEHVTT